MFGKAVTIFMTSSILGTSAWAQSTITLDSFDLEQRDVEARSEMRDCLLDPTKCENEEYRGSVSITLDDVVNLGVIDRSEVVTDEGETFEERSAAVGDLPSIDIEILFAYDSDELTPDAYIKLAELSAALADPRFNDMRLLFIGHTDSVGSAAYNSELSRRRAERVASYIQQAISIDPSKVAAVGVGYARPKDPLNPRSGVNRRVQLVVVTAE